MTEATSAGHIVYTFLSDQANRDTTFQCERKPESLLLWTHKSLPFGGINPAARTEYIPELRRRISCSVGHINILMDGQNNG